MPKGPMSDETKAKIAAALRERWSNPEFRAKMHDAMSHPRSPMPEERKEKIRQSMLGRKLSQETKDRIAESKRGRKHSEETKQKISDARKVN